MRTVRQLSVIGLLMLLCSQAWALDVPALRGRVNDLAGLLNEHEAAHLENLLAAHEQKTGQQFALLVIDSLEGDPVEDFSIRVVEAWKLGKAKRDDGLLLLIVTKDRKMRIEVGYGLEGQITDAVSSSVIRDILRPAFRNNAFGVGVDRGLRTLMAAAGDADVGIDPNYAQSQQSASDEKDHAVHILYIIFIVIFILLSMNRRGRGGGRFYGGGWGGGGGWGSGGGGGYSGGGGGFGGGGASGGW